MIITPYRNNIFGGRGESAFTIAKSFLLDGVDEYFGADDVYTNNSTDTVGTLSAVVKSVNVLPSATAFICSFSNSGVLNSISITQKTDGTIQFAIVEGSAKCVIVTDSAVDLTSWTKIDVVQNGILPVIYINGVAVAQTNSTSTDNTLWLNDITFDNFSIGRQYRLGVNSYDFNGYVSQVAYLNTNISAAQSLDWYNNGKPKNAQNLFGSNCKFFFNPDNRTGDTAQFSVVDSVNSITATSVNLEDADLSPLTPYSDAIQTIINKYATLNAWSFANIGINGTTTTAYDYKGTHDLSNPSVANQPTFIGGDANINNYPSAYFVTDDYLYKATADYLIGQSTGCIHAVFTTNADVSSQWAFFSSCDEASTNYFFNFVVYLGKIYFTIRNTTAVGQRYEGYCNTTSILANTSYVVSVYQNGTTLQVLINGVAQSLVINNGTAETYWFSDITNRDNISIGALIYSSSVYSDLDIALVQVTSDSADATVLANHNELKTLYGI